ncbi:MAG TPA: PilZ domain-containing protein [Pyrinomonadaceae bacterium]
MPQQEKFKRIRERLELKLPVRVRCRETPEIEWTEVTRLIDVSPFGARFTLKHPIERGRLLHMTIPMPRQLRVFDHVEDQYRVWALVRFVQSTTTAGSSVFEIGVAFIGKHPPRSYEENPAKRYDIKGRASDSLSIPEELEQATTEDQRTQTRHNIPVDIRIETLNENGESDLSESTVAENISQKGAAIYTTLDLPVGRMIRLTSEQYNLTVHAAVRGRSVGASGVQRIHVEFIDREFPL